MSIDFWTADSLAALPWLAHGVTGRTGGVSEEPFASLNLGLHVGDDSERVCENRRLMSAALGFEAGRMVCAEQVHGGQVACVTESEAGRGASRFADTIPGVDALVTNTSGLLLTLFFADCVPVLFVDPERHVVAVAHAGWRGMAGEVLENTVRVMEAQFHCELQKVLAAVGPCIGPTEFEVGGEVAAHFPASSRQTGEKFYVDLPQEARRRLIGVGIEAANITLSGECTASQTDRYFSHRREGEKTGRIAAAIGIRS